LHAGEELADDALSVTKFKSWVCNDYVLAEIGEEGLEGGKSYVVLSPRVEFDHELMEKRRRAGDDEEIKSKATY